MALKYAVKVHFLGPFWSKMVHILTTLSTSWDLVFNKQHLQHSDTDVTCSYAPSATLPTQFQSEAPQVTPHVGMRLVMTWCKVLRMGEGGFSTSGSCWQISARWEVFTDDEGPSRVSQTINYGWPSLPHSCWSEVRNDAQIPAWNL